LVSFLLIWVAINVFFAETILLNSYFKIAYGSTIVILSIHHINRFIIHSNTPFLKNSIALICTGLVLFYMYSVIVECFWLYGIGISIHFQRNIFIVMAFVNLVTNLIFAFAILWIPNKQNFILQSSSPAAS
jgi:hypothetical protein